MLGAPMLEVLALTKRLGGLLAVSGASLTVAQGEIVGLIGPNGGGKTTLFAMISGFVPPDSGTVRLDGDDVTGTPPHEICRRGGARTLPERSPVGRLRVPEKHGDAGPPRPS